MHIVRTRRGARLVHGGHVVSELPARPGPTDSVFDVIAACVRAMALETGRIAMLGFAAGGTVAPLRALGCVGAIEAVDLDTTAVSTFRELAATWSGPVSVDRADAVKWLDSRRIRYAAIVEDLSLQVPGDVTKPAVSYEQLPRLMARRIGPEGVAVVNLLPVPGMSWPELERRVAAPFDDVRIVRLEEFDNRILVGGQGLPTARGLGARVERLLRGLRSSQAGRFSVRSGP